MKKLFFFSCFLTSLIFISCKKSDDNSSAAIDCSGTAPKFSTDASQVFQTKCATGSSCHGTGATNSGGVLTTHTQIFDKRASIRSSVMSGSMPKNSSLTAAEKKAIICWIDAGAANN